VFGTTAAPVISGTPLVGKKLSVAPPIWSPSGATFTYQWLRDGAKIASATKTNYLLTKKDLGSVISVVVTGKKIGYLSVKVESLGAPRIS
jgi:hypothetical protein